MKTFALITALAVLAIGISINTAHAGDKNSTWFRQQSALVGVGFDGTACSKYPLPGLQIDGEDNCAKVPNTYLYKKTTSDGVNTREVRVLEDTYEESSKITPDGTIMESSVKVKSGRSVDGNFGRSQRLSVSDVTNIFGQADTSSNTNRTFSTGLAAARRSTQDPQSADQAP